MKWKKAIKLLGIHISYDKEDMQILNFENKIPKINQILNRWKQRNLTIYGKILLLKSFALSQLIYTTAVLTPSDDFIKKNR